MHILKISDVYFPRINGVSTSIRTIRNEMQRMGHRVTLVIPDYRTDAHETDDEDIIRISSRKVIFDPEDYMISYQQTLKALSRKKFDIVHIHTPFVAHYAGLKISRTLNIPAVLTYHTYFEEYLHHYVPFLPKTTLGAGSRYITRHQCNSADGIISPSVPMQDILKKYGVSRPIRVIPTGIPNSRFMETGPDLFRKRYNIDANRPTLLHVGRVAHEKNIRFLLEVVAKIKEEIPGIYFIIAGEGPAEKSLKRYTQKLGITDNTKFIGYLYDQDLLNSCYQSANLHIFASKTETQGLVLLEAMALGVPVVSTAYLGTRDILKEGVGARIAPDNVEAFKAIIVNLLQNKEECRLLGQQGKEYARHWSVPVLVQKIIDYYAEQVGIRQSLTQTELTPEQQIPEESRKTA